MLLPFSAVKAEIGTMGRLIRRASVSDSDLSEGGLQRGDCFIRAH